VPDRWEQRLRDLRVSAPQDLWSRVEEGPKGPPPANPPRRGQRLVAASVAILVFAAAGAFGWHAFRGGTPVAAPVSPTGSPPINTSHRLSSSAIVSGGKAGPFRCTATIPKVLNPGVPTGVRFTMTNPTSKVELFGAEKAWLIFDRNGVQLQDSFKEEIGLIGGYSVPQPLAPGASKQIFGGDTAVLWPGPLRVIPVCNSTHLPALKVQVAEPGAPATSEAAISQTVAAFGSYFDHCRPQQSGVWVTGRVPNGSATVDARCAALVIAHPGFDIVALATVSPPDGQAVDLTQLPGLIEAVPSILQWHGPPTDLHWWVMVATARGVVCSRTERMYVTGSSGGSGPAECPSGTSSR
jgi:hypothetical protein